MQTDSETDTLFDEKSQVHNKQHTYRYIQVEVHVYFLVVYEYKVWVKSEFRISMSCSWLPNVSSCTWLQFLLRGSWQAMGEERQDPSGGLMYNQFLWCIWNAKLEWDFCRMNFRKWCGCGSWAAGKKRDRDSEHETNDSFEPFWTLTISKWMVWMNVSHMPTPRLFVLSILSPCLLVCLFVCLFVCLSPCLLACSLVNVTISDERCLGALAALKCQTILPKELLWYFFETHFEVEGVCKGHEIQWNRSQLAR